MILLVGPGNDPPLRALAAALQVTGAEFVVVDANLRLATPWLPDAEAVLSVDGREVPLDGVRSAYLRPFGLTHRDNQERTALETLLAWADSTSARIVNRPAASLANNSKPLQSQLISRLGLRVPETLVTTDPLAAREFARQHGEVVYKSISGERSIVRRLSEDRHQQLTDVANCPTQFQRYIPGDELRVHVIGNCVRALRIESDCDDYRYAARSGAQVSASPIVLDSTTAESLRSIVRQMGLLVAGIDLRRTSDGELFCLEVNPSPGFTYFEQLAGVTLSRDIATLLLQAERCGRDGDGTSDLSRTDTDTCGQAPRNVY